MRNQRGNMLLIELTIVLFFFAIAQVIVLQVFAKAQEINQEASLVNRALIKAEDTAETLAVSRDAVETLLSLGFETTDDGYALPQLDGYRLTATINRLTQPAGVLTSVELTAFQGDELLFTLPTLRYQGGNGT